MKPVDCLGSEKVRRELDFLMPALQTEPPAVRQKALVAVAWSYLRHNDLEQALNVLDNVTPEYVRDIMPVQMRADPAFDRMAEAVAKALVEGQVYVPLFHVPDGAVASKEAVA